MNNTNVENNKTEPYIYVIVILAPILLLYLLQKCLLHACLYCHRGTCCLEDDDYNYEIDAINVSIESNKVNLDNEVDDRFDDIDNIST